MGRYHRHRVLHPDPQLPTQHDLVADGAARLQRQLHPPEHVDQHHHRLQQLLQSSGLRAEDGLLQEGHAETAQKESLQVGAIKERGA